MKAFLVLALIFVTLGCKKEKASEDITAYKWVLKTAIVTPAITVNGKTTTDYKNSLGENSCLANNYTFKFFNTGIYQISSTGSLCDMVPNGPDQKWTREGNIVTMTYKSTTPNTLTIKGNEMVQTGTYKIGDKDHTIVYTYVATK